MCRSDPDDLRVNKRCTRSIDTNVWSASAGTLINVAVHRGRIPITGATTSSGSGTAFSVTKGESMEKGENKATGTGWMRA